VNVAGLLKRRRANRCTLLMLAVVLFDAPIATADSQPPSVKELQQKIEKRDAVITDLMRRVETLERKLVGASTADQTEKTMVQGAAGRANTAPTETTAPAEEEISRALERTLVREGALVLPRGSIELEPRFTYTYRGSDQLQIVTSNGQQVVAEQDTKRDRMESSFNVRLGLPWYSQIEVRIPYILDQEETVTATMFKRERQESGFGDIEVGLTKQLFWERGWRPDLLTFVNWKSKTGGSSIGSGFHSVQGGLTAVKRRDPLAFFGTLSYTGNLSDSLRGNSIDPGDAISFRFGTVFATSPDTSLRFAFEFSRAGKLESEGRKVPGSNTSVGLFELGLATIVYPQTLLDFRAAIGLTSDSPDFRLGISLPFRFR
jgi:hypothetical protein